MRGCQLVRHLLDALEVAICDDDVCAAGSKHAGGRTADSTRTAGDQRNAACELADRRRLRQLVALERPVLDRECLALAQRTKAADSFCRILDRNRTVVEVASGARSRRVDPGSDDPNAGDEHDPRSRGIDRKLPRLLVDVALVILAVPSRVLRHPECE